MNYIFSQLHPSMRAHDRHILAEISAGTTKGHSLVNIRKIMLIPGTLAFGVVAGLGGGAIISAATANAATDTASTTESTTYTTAATDASTDEATTAAATTTDESDGTSDTETATATTTAANDQATLTQSGDCPSERSTN